MRRSLFFGGFILLALSTAAMADLADPGIKVLGGDPPTCASPVMDITTGINDVQVIPGCTTETFNFINNIDNFPKVEDHAAIIQGFVFETTLATGLTGLAATFTCSSDYFKSCLGSYNINTGLLDYVFSGVNPPDNDEYCKANNTPKDTEIGEKEGIPACGIFNIQLSGFTGIDTPTKPFNNTVITSAPEPSSVVLMLGQLGLFFGVLQFVRRRKSA